VANVEAQPTAPTALPAVGTMLVVQADGTGVPLGQPPTQRRPMRLGKGPKRTTKQAAVVTGLDPRAPDPRPPQAVVAALWQAPDGRAPGARPVPVGQERRATLAGQAIARARRVERAAPRDEPHIQARVARTEGAEALQQQWLARVPAHTWVLDSIHATESLWDAAHALLGDPHPHRTAWVRSDLEPLVPDRQRRCSRPWKRQPAIPRARRPHGRPYAARSALIGATAHLGTPTSTWHRAGRVARASSQGPVGIW
jgi:hypothetical protein